MLDGVVVKSGQRQIMQSHISGAGPNGGTQTKPVGTVIVEFLEFVMIITTN